MLELNWEEWVANREHLLTLYKKKIALEVSKEKTDCPQSLDKGTQKQLWYQHRREKKREGLTGRQRRQATKETVHQHTL